jgi:universal stress protein A
MEQWKRILCPVDFSEVSLHALHYGLDIARSCGASVVLLHVVEPIVAPADFSFGPLTNAEVEDQMAGRAGDSLEELKAKAGFPADRLSTRVERGRSFTEICRVAREEKVNLIVIATHGYTGITHALLGSTAEKVVRKASCPVLAVKPESHEAVEV